jgi:hypothetical protein
VRSFKVLSLSMSVNCHVRLFVLEVVGQAPTVDQLIVSYLTQGVARVARTGEQSNDLPQNREPTSPIQFPPQIKSIGMLFPFWRSPLSRS